MHKFKTELYQKYGLESTDGQAATSKELLNIKVKPEELVENYTDRFQKLAREAAHVGEEFLPLLYINSLVRSISNHVNLASCSLNLEQKININFLAGIAKRFQQELRAYGPTVRNGNMFPKQQDGSTYRY